ncbi:MAG: 30S ribosomal protein S6 [Mycoplasmataceae bacterium]|nr:30S ribosomal protein S6 [Mycoplasmataceae bacterium]
MAKYEIMLLVDGTLDEKTAKTSIKELIDIIDKNEKFEFTNLGIKDMAYIIRNQKRCWYFQYNFISTIPSQIAEFRRLALINKIVLRHLIINLEKDYGYRAINNPKKVKISEIKMKKFKEKQARIRTEREAREKAQTELAEMKKEVNHE